MKNCNLKMGEFLKEIMYHYSFIKIISDISGYTGTLLKGSLQRIYPQK